MGEVEDVGIIKKKLSIRPLKRQHSDVIQALKMLIRELNHKLVTMAYLK